MLFGIAGKKVITSNSKTALGSGTVYALTATPAAIDFGTTDPSIVLDQAGTYLIFARVQARHAAATFAASRTTTFKLRRTNNTPADLTGGTVTGITGIVTTLTAMLMEHVLMAVYTTANVDDIITLFGDVSVLPSAGALNVSEAQIVAVRLQT